MTNPSSTVAQQPQKTQHRRLALEDALNDYRTGWMNATQLVRNYVLIRCAPGWQVKLNRKKVCDELNVSQASFYRAIAKMADKGEIVWHEPEEIIISRPITVKSDSNLNCNSSTSKTELSSSFLSSENPILNSENPVISSENPVISSENLVISSENLEAQTPNKNGQSDDSADLDHIYSDLDHISLSKEREKKPEITPEFKEWLKNKAIQLPCRPTLIEQWIESEASKEANQRQFSEEHSSYNRANVSAAANNSPKKLTLPPEIEAALKSGSCVLDPYYPKYEGVIDANQKWWAFEDWIAQNHSE